MRALIARPVSGSAPLHFNLSGRAVADDIVEHTAKDEKMKRQYGVPVKSPQHPCRPVGSRLPQVVATVAADNPELQPGLSRQNHFCIQQQPALLFIGSQYPPEIEGVACVNIGSIGAATSQPHPTEKLIHESADLPQKIAIVPAPVPADGPDIVQHLVDVALD